MKSPEPIPLRLLVGALLCFSCLGAVADTSSTSQAVSSTANPYPKTAALKLPASLTNLVISYPNVSYGESAKLLDSKVSLKVNDAAFLSVLDAVLTSAGVTCNVECRGVKAMKLSLDLKEAPAGALLDGLARAGGVRLWVFATKILIAPEFLLTKDEMKSAKLYGVLASDGMWAMKGALNKSAKGLEIINTKISVDINNLSWNDAWDPMVNQVLRKHREGYSTGFGYSEGVVDGLRGLPTISASFQNANFGDVMAFIAHSAGSEAYILPDETRNGIEKAHFIVCPASLLSPEIKAKAIPLFTASSTHFDFRVNPNIDPSINGS